MPRYGAILEFLNFAFLLALFILCLSCKYLPFLRPFASTTSFQIKILIRPTSSNFSSSFLPQGSLWMNTQHPYSMAGVVRSGTTILSLSSLTTRLVYIANVRIDRMTLRIMFLKQNHSDVECLRHHFHCDYSNISYPSIEGAFIRRP